jgi:DNA helicase-2/ATP-dependent DNA helicase PcrA
MSSTIKKVFGPPGSGKTTYLLNVVDQELSAGISPANIGYFSFTRKAATEARDRAIAKFPHLSAQTDFPFFRTLHSLAFYCLSVKVDDMMQPEHYVEFAQQAGIQLDVNTDSEEGYVKADNPILNEINLARIRGHDLRTHYNQCGLDIEWYHFEFVERTYRHYKTARSLLDFTDLLEMVVLEQSRLPKLEVLIVDEAQDLSRLQWQLVYALAKRSKRIFLGGDDDQAVFTWAGADVRSFLEFEGDVHILQQSYRVPSSVHTLANKVVHRIRSRQQKEWKPRDYVGAVRSYYRFEDVAINDGQWLILASTNYMLNPIHEWLKSNGVLFERNNVPSISTQMIKAVLDWERLRKGIALGLVDVQGVYKYLGSQSVARGFKTFKGDPDVLEYTLKDLQQSYGLLTTEVWHESLIRISEDKREYLRAILRRGFKLSSADRIKLSTIHGAKGGEADNVMLLLDLSPRFAKDYATNSDDVNRLFYVGITRTKQELHLILPKQQSKGFML